MLRKLNAVLLIAVAALAILCLVREARIRSMREELARCTLTSSRPPLAPLPREEEVSVPAAEEDVEAASATESDAAVEKRAAVRKKPQSEFVRMMSDPKRKEFMDAAWSLEMDRAYGPLFRYIEMSPAELRYFRSLLIEKRAAVETCAVKLMDPNLDTAARAELIRERDAAAAETDARIIDFLGPEAGAEYEAYEESLPDRNMLLECKTTLAARGVPLSYDQEDKVIRLMYEERQAGSELKDMFDGTAAAAGLSAAEVEERLRGFDAWRERVGTRSAAVLESRQQALFTNHLARLRDAVEVGFSMAPLFGGEAESSE